MPTTSTINQSFNGLFEFLQDRPVIAGDPTSLPFRFTQGVELRGELAALTRDVNIYSAFINNQWQPANNLTINLGVRYDWQLWRRRPQRPGHPERHSDRAVRYARSPATCAGRTSSRCPTICNNVAPRLGVTWDPKRQRPHRGARPATASTTTRSTPRPCAASSPATRLHHRARSPTTRDRAPRILNDFFPNLPTRRPSRQSVGTAFRIASDSAESPYTHQMTVGTTRQLGTDYARRSTTSTCAARASRVTRNVNARRADGTFPILAVGAAAAALRRRRADAHPPGAVPARRSASPTGSASWSATRSAAPRRWPTTARCRITTMS